MPARRTRIDIRCPAPLLTNDPRAELFFDLVFVFAFTQVTTLLVDDPAWGGLGRGLRVVAVLWWAWACYAWLTNTVDADDGIVLAVMLGRNRDARLAKPTHLACA
jgi:hypothetical protein